MQDGVKWSYYNNDKFDAIEHRYLPMQGEGKSIATQVVTAVTKLVYKWYNDGDVYDNRYYLGGWCNNLSSYANWLYKWLPDKAHCLTRIDEITSEAEYELILKELADNTHDIEWLAKMHEKPKVDSIYDCDGPFRFVEEEEEEDEEW